MKSKIVLILVALSLFTSGCVLLVGGAGAAGGYYLGKEGYKVKVEKEGRKDENKERKEK